MDGILYCQQKFCISKYSLAAPCVVNGTLIGRWCLLRGNDQLWPSNCAKDTAFSFLNNFDGDDDVGGVIVK